MHARVVLGVGKGVLFIEVTSVQECPHRERGSTILHTVLCSIYTVRDVCTPLCTIPVSPGSRIPAPRSSSSSQHTLTQSLKAQSVYSKQSTPPIQVGIKRSMQYSHCTVYACSVCVCVYILYYDGQCVCVCVVCIYNIEHNARTY